MRGSRADSCAGGGTGGTPRHARGVQEEQAALPKRRTSQATSAGLFSTSSVKEPGVRGSTASGPLYMGWGNSR